MFYNATQYNLMELINFSKECPAFIFKGPRISTVFCQRLVACLAYSSTPRMEAISSSETSVNFYQSKQHRVLKYITLYNYYIITF
jgi:hypothetical protein